MSKVRVDLSQAVKQLNEFNNAGIKQAAVELEKQIIKEISQGRSPVKQANPRRFQRYSDSYRKAIKKNRYGSTKRVSPVNLKLTGKLLKSLFSRPIGSNRIRIGFDNKLADIHNRRGAGKSGVVRRMLPTRAGETFTDSIFKSVLARLDKIANRVFK